MPPGLMPMSVASVRGDRELDIAEPVDRRRLPFRRAARTGDSGASSVTRSPTSISSPVAAGAASAARWAATGMKMPGRETWASPAEPQLPVGQAERPRRRRPTTPPPRTAARYRDPRTPTPRPAPRRRAGPCRRRMDHRHVHRRRQVGHGLREHGRAAPDVPRRDQVGRVDDAGVRRDPGGDPVTRGHEAVFEPVVGEELR